MTVTVIGLGKIGLPLAVQYAMKGEQVFGVDINQKTVDCVNEGLEPFPEEKNLKEFLAEVVYAGRLKASTSTSECVSKSNVVVVVVPLFVDGNSNPDYTAIDSATTEIARGLNKGTLIAYETTLPIGTTRMRFTKLVEKISGLKVGEDFFVVFSPERVLTGRIFEDLRKYPKVLGGVTPQCSEIGLSFYSRVLDFDTRGDLSKPNGVWVVGNSETAEFVKLAETTYRDVNIALANVFAIHAEEQGVNIFEVIEAANSQQFSRIHLPGIAVGGHCIPVYPKFYLSTDTDAKLIREARVANEDMPKHVVDLLEIYLNSLIEKKILILGLSYRSGVKESYGSGAYSLRDEIQSRGGLVLMYDRLYDTREIIDLGFEPWTPDLLEISAVIIQNDDSSYVEFLVKQSMELVPIFDGRRLFSENSTLNVVYQLGNPSIQRQVPSQE